MIKLYERFPKKGSAVFVLAFDTKKRRWVDEEDPEDMLAHKPLGPREKKHG